MNLSDLTHCFYVPGKPGILDAVHPKTGRGVYGGRTLAETQQENPGAIMATFDRAIAESEDLSRLPVSFTNETQFDEMLNVLPPAGWIRGDFAEFFKMSERYSGIITDIYVRVYDDYFHLRDDITLPHSEIVDRCIAYRDSIEANQG